MPFLVDLSIVLVLVACNAFFSMAEIAILSARRVRLAQLAARPVRGAARALALSRDPTRFLSTVQAGMTGIGILSGAVGEATLVGHIRGLVERWPLLAPYAEPVSLVVMVTGLTYLSIIVGELVPKRLALTNPELIAARVAPFIDALSRVAAPLVRMLGLSTEAVLRLFGVPHVRPSGVSLEELQGLLDQGLAECVFDRAERELVSNVFTLDQRRVREIATPRPDIVFLDVRAPIRANYETLMARPHAALPLCDGSLDQVIGVIRAARLLSRLLHDEPADLRALAEPPLFVPGSLTLMELLDQFRLTHLPVALVVDEHGGIEGLVSLSDLVPAIVGELPMDPGEVPLVVSRGDGSWLIDGAAGLAVVDQTLGAPISRSLGRARCATLGSLAMHSLGRVPRAGDAFTLGEFRFEVVDMDGHRVDQMLVSRTR